MELHYKISDAARMLGVCTKTIRRWHATGLIACKRTVGNHRRISILEIERVLHGNQEKNKRKIAIYGRVSSHDQKKKGDLERQVKTIKEYCEKNNQEIEYIFTDVGSGLNTKRSGLKKLCKLVEQEKIEKVILSYPDRLTRFGFDYLTRYFTSHGTSILALQEKETRSMQEEHVQGMIK